MTPPAHHHTAAHTGGQRHGPRATARRNDTDTSDTSKDGQRHGHRDHRRRNKARKHQHRTPAATGASGGGTLPPDKASTQGQRTPPRRTTGKARKRAATGHERTTADQWTSGRPKGRQRPRKRPPRPRTDTTTDRPPARRTDTSGKGRQPVHQPHGRTPPRRTATASASTGGHQYGKPHRHRHGRRPTRADHWRPVQTSFWGVRREPCLYSSACKWKCDQHTSKSCRGRRGHRRRGRAEVARREFF